MKTISEVMNTSQFEHKKTYYKNGKNAIRGTIETYEFMINNNNVKIEAIVVIYSYRWHKKVWKYYINGLMVNRPAIKKLIKNN